MLNPAHKYEAALASVLKDPKGCLKSKCPLENLLAVELAGQAATVNALYRAYEIFRGRRNSKIIMESMLFCLESPKILIDKISTHMNVSKAVPEAYLLYFFDSSVFQDMFDRLDYIEELAKSDKPFDIKDKVTKQLSITEGFNFILSHFKGGIIEYTASEYLKRLLAIANKYVAQAQNTGILSKESDKLFKWMQLASKLSISLQSLQDNSLDDALQDIRIALSYDEPPDSIDTIPPDDVLRG